MPYARENVKTNMIKPIINNNGSNVKQDTTAAIIKFGDLGETYYMLPKAFMYFKWVLRYSKLSHKEIDLIDTLFGFWANLGLFPSLKAIGDSFGVDRSDISRMLNSFAGKGKEDNKTLTCPICNHTSLILSITRRKKDNGENTSSLYDLEPLLTFLDHLNDEHTRDEWKQARLEYGQSNYVRPAKKKELKEF